MLFKFQYKICVTLVFFTRVILWVISILTIFSPTFDRGRPQIYILNQPLEVGHDGIMGGSRDDPLGETKWRLDPASTKKYMYIYHIYICMYNIYIYVCIYKLVVAFKVGCLKQWMCSMNFAVIIHCPYCSLMIHTYPKSCSSIDQRLTSPSACWIVGSFIQKPNFIVDSRRKFLKFVVLFVAKVSGKSKPSYFLAWLSRKQENIIGYLYRIM